jgi:hypothetical protein
VEKELLEEGVAVMGMVTEDWMRALEDHCATVPYDTVLSLGCERREDSYKVATVSRHLQRTALHHPEHHAAPRNHHLMVPAVDNSNYLGAETRFLSGGISCQTYRGHRSQLRGLNGCWGLSTSLDMRASSRPSRSLLMS